MGQNPSGPQCLPYLARGLQGNPCYVIHAEISPPLPRKQPQGSEVVPGRRLFRSRSWSSRRLCTPTLIRVAPAE